MNRRPSMTSQIEFGNLVLLSWCCHLDSPLPLAERNSHDPSSCGIKYIDTRIKRPISLQWRHNNYDGVSNHQPHGCLLNRLFERRAKKTSKLRVTGLCAGNSPGPVNSPHKGPVTRKMFPFDDVIMFCLRNFKVQFPSIRYSYLELKFN